MLNELFTNTTTTTTFHTSSFVICTVFSLLFGAIIAIAYTYRNTYSKSFLTTLALLPAIVQMVIMLVNGNLGTGVAVMGAFSLVRFRSIPGTAKDICSIFFAMAVGLATGMGYLLIAGIFVIIMIAISIFYTIIDFGSTKKELRQLHITIPESLNYSTVFDDLFAQYTIQHELIQIKTTSMGSLYKLQYKIIMKDSTEEKNFIDALRCRNGNLEISCGKLALEKIEL